MPDQPAARPNWGRPSPTGWGAVPASRSSLATPRRVRPSGGGRRFRCSPSRRPMASHSQHAPSARTLLGRVHGRLRQLLTLDLHRTFAEVVAWEDGRLRHAGRVDMTRGGLESFARTLRADDEVVIEVTGNAMVVSHLLRQHAARVVIANPLQVKAIAHAHVKTDKDRRWRARQPLCGRVPAVGLDAGCGDRAVAPARGAAQPGGPPSHPAQERNPRDPARSLVPRVRMPTCSAGSAELGWNGRLCR